MTLVSIIIPTYNSAQTLEACLISIQKQEYWDIEIIVVDNFSPDDTFHIAKQFTSKVFQKGPERTAQKNFGITQAQWIYVCFIDSDMTLWESVIKQCIKKMQSSQNIGGVCIPERSVGRWFFVKVRDFERSFYEGTSVESARFFRTSEVVEVGGFEEDLIFFEESLLPQKIEAKLWLSTKHRIHSMIAHDESGIKLWKWLKKKYYYGQSLSQYQKKVKEIGIPETGAGQIGILGRYMIFLKNKRFYTRPILAVCVLGLKTLEFVSGALGIIFKK